MLRLLLPRGVLGREDDLRVEVRPRDFNAGLIDAQEKPIEIGMHVLIEHLLDVQVIQLRADSAQGALRAKQIPLFAESPEIMFTDLRARCRQYATARGNS